PPPHSTPFPYTTLFRSRPKDMNLGGFTPLLFAAREGCIECAKHLIAGGADPDLHDPHRVPPLSMALLNLHFDLAAYLIEAGADIDRKSTRLNSSHVKIS